MTTGVLALSPEPTTASATVNDGGSKGSSWPMATVTPLSVCAAVTAMSARCGTPFASKLTWPPTGSPACGCWAKSKNGSKLPDESTKARIW